MANNLLNIKLREIVWLAKLLAGNLTVRELAILFAEINPPKGEIHFGQGRWCLEQVKETIKQHFYVKFVNDNKGKTPPIIPVSMVRDNGRSASSIKNKKEE